VPEGLRGRRLQVRRHLQHLLHGAVRVHAQQRRHQPHGDVPGPAPRRPGPGARLQVQVAVGHRAAGAAVLGVHAGTSPDTP
jgi:hypothetical protein